NAIVPGLRTLSVIDSVEVSFAACSGCVRTADVPPRPSDATTIHGWGPLLSHGNAPRSPDSKPSCVSVGPASSTSPSQSSSSPVPHASVPATTPPSHVLHAPSTHDCVPSSQTPWLTPHAREVPSSQSQPSSVAPSQSSSSPLHVSVPASVAPSQAPKTPPTHVSTPTLHSPTSLPQPRV